VVGAAVAWRLVVPVAVEVAELFVVVVEFAVAVTAAVVMFEIPPE
jgi:hypothetical protein